MHTCFHTIPQSHGTASMGWNMSEWLGYSINYYNIHIHHNIPSTCTIPVILLVLQGKGQ